MSASASARQRVAEIHWGRDPGAIAWVGTRSVHQFWPLLSPYFRDLLLPPQRRSEAEVVTWAWNEPDDARPPSASELAALRKRLGNEQQAFAENLARAGASNLEPGGQKNQGNVDELGSVMASVVARLIGRSDAELVGFVCRTERGLRLHSWGAAAPARVKRADSHGCEITGLVMIDGHAAPAQEIVLTREDGSELGRILSGSDGMFAFSGIAEGRYRVRATAPEFSPEGLEVSIDQESTGRVELQGSARAKHRPPAVAQASSRARGRAMFFGVAVLTALLFAGGAWVWNRRQNAQASGGIASSAAQAPVVGNPRANAVSATTRPVQGEARRSLGSVQPPSRPKESAGRMPDEFSSSDGGKEAGGGQKPAMARPGKDVAAQIADETPAAQSEEAGGERLEVPRSAKNDDSAKSALSSKSVESRPEEKEDPDLARGRSQPAAIALRSAPPAEELPQAAAVVPAKASESEVNADISRDLPVRDQPVESLPNRSSAKASIPNSKRSPSQRPSDRAESSDQNNKTSSAQAAGRDAEAPPEDDAAHVADIPFQSHSLDDALQAELVQRLVLRPSAWRPQVVVDAILPTAPTRVGAESQIERAREQALREQRSRLPATFKHPNIQVGLAFELSSTNSSLRLRWRTASLRSTAVTDSAVGRAEFFWSVGLSEAGQSYRLDSDDDRVVAVLRLGPEGELLVEAVADLQISYWVIIRHSPTDPTETSKPGNAPRFRWCTPSGSRLPVTWQITTADEPFRSERVEIPLHPSNAGTIHAFALLDTWTGWGLTQQLTLQRGSRLAREN